MRECYRTQKHPVLTFTETHSIGISVFFIYTGKELPEYAQIKEKTASAIQLLIKKLTPPDK
jgi:ribonuclease P protein component